MERITKRGAARRLLMAVSAGVVACCSLVSMSCLSASYVIVWERTAPAPCMSVDVDNEGTVLVAMWSLGAQLIGPDGAVEWVHEVGPGVSCTGATMSPDGSRIAVTDTAGHVRLLTRAGEVVAEAVVEEAEYISRPNLSENGELLLLTLDGNPCVMTAIGGDLLGPTVLGELFEGKGGCVTAISADGECIVAGCSSDPQESGYPSDFDIHLLDRDGNVLWSYEVPWMPQTAIGISASGDTIAVPVGDEIYVLDKGGREVSRIRTGTLGEVSTSASGDEIVSVQCEGGDKPGAVRVTDPHGVVDWQWEDAWDCADSFPALAVSPDAKSLVIAIGDRVVLLRRQLQCPFETGRGRLRQRLANRA
ncbi:MAG: hypothetical protein JSW65_00930 [Candidatus Bipolaricaulota bacterium]|nr:MAG: hypothetical protein JSW65_00930 [Candidatus Bipolaricaulota bacterium]